MAAYRVCYEQQIAANSNTQIKLAELRVPLLCLKFNKSEMWLTCDVQVLV